MPDAVTSNEPTAGLLASVFPGSPVSSREYLDWLYERSPFGHVIEANLDDEGGRAGHYALVPITLARDGVDHSAALSLNTAVHPRARGAGTFVRLATEAIDAARKSGVESIVGVANANSTPGFVRRLGFKLIAPLQASVLVPTLGSLGGWRSAWASDEEVASADGLAEVEALLSPPSDGEARRWNAATLQWRLERPGASYALHRADGAFAVSCVDVRHRIRVAIVLKVFAAGRVDRAAQRAIVRAVCRFHRAPLALHVGLSDLVDFRGLALPRRLRESPLNLIHRDLLDAGTPPRIARFEFLDFDAY